ncbi:MAG: hypothetical protein IKX25_10205 [Bacteroidales bacterium]|nr:hypothetical protein [Bacteroidales bacterium]
MKRNDVIKYALSLLLGVLVFLFWWLLHPEYLCYHEQNQLFLTTGDYFLERIAVAGGFADWLSEFLVQFYYYPSCGALIIALLMMALQVLTFLAFRNKECSWSPFVLSFIPVLFTLQTMGDMDLLLSFPVSVILSLSVYLLARRWGFWAQLVVMLPLYWLVGTAFIVQVGMACVDELIRHRWTKGIVRSLILLAAAGLWFYVCRTFWMAQYPWNTVLSGINYHRLTIRMMSDPSQSYLLYPTLVALAAFCHYIRYQKTKPRGLKSGLELWTSLPLLVCVLLFAAINYSNDYDPNIDSLLEQNYLIRKGNWKGIIQLAEQHRKEALQAMNSEQSSTAVNLALAMEGQLANRMFTFSQRGMHSLLMPWKRDNLTCVPTMEAFWQLGFVNESMRYAFDLQESILNFRKSGRFTKRIAECNIINGKYDVASKYIDQLKHTLFYRDWARQAETYLYDEDKIAQHPDWSRKRQIRLENDFLYYYPEMTKMLGQLVLRNRQNQLAYDYFMASLLLAGDAQSFVANLPQQPQPNTDPFPKGYREYVEYMKAHPMKADVVTGATSHN